MRKSYIHRIYLKCNCWRCNFRFDGIASFELDEVALCMCVYVYVVNNEITNSTDELNYAETSESTTLIGEHARVQNAFTLYNSLYLSKNTYLPAFLNNVLYVSKLLNLNFSSEFS